MASFIIEGGHNLKEKFSLREQKNEALQILCAVLLTPQKVIINNVPNIVDINILIELLIDLGVKVERLSKDRYSFQADDINLDYLTSEKIQTKGARIRGSIMIVGPLLARFGKGFIPRPGGDKIGRRRLDTHFIGFQNLELSLNTIAKKISIALPRMA